VILRPIIKGFLATCLAVSNLCSASSDEVSKRLNKEIGFISKEWKDQYNLHVLGSGGAGQDQVELIILCYYTVGDYSIETSRRLIVERGQELLQRINKNKDIKIHLKNYPLSAKHLFLAVSFFDEFEKGYARPDKVASARISHGKVIYTIRDHDGTSKVIHEETFEEACRLVDEEKKKE